MEISDKIKSYFSRYPQSSEVFENAGILFHTRGAADSYGKTVTKRYTLAEIEASEKQVTADMEAAEEAKEAAEKAAEDAKTAQNLATVAAEKAAADIAKSDEPSKTDK